MTNDLVKRLRDFEQWMREPEDKGFILTSDLFDDAASRIEQLEAALTTIGYGPPNEGNALTILNEFVDIARAALGKEGDKYDGWR
jgi:hypothetical protein